MSGSYLQSLGLNQVSPVINSTPSSDDGLDLDLFTNSTFDFLDADFGFEAPREEVKKEEGGGKPRAMDLFTAEDMFKTIPSLNAVPGPFAGDFNAGISTETITTLSPLPPPPQITSPISVAPVVATVVATVATPTPAPTPTSTTPAPTPAAPKGRKRAASSATSAEVSTAADEDKRRRNTAASARFRVKKKQHEQQLKEKAKELTEHAKSLEERIKKLEMENELLRSLIVEKNGGSESSLGVCEEDDDLVAN